MDIRPARRDDAADVARLTGQLGYLCTASQSRRRLEALIADERHLVLVVEGGDGGHLTGWIHVREVAGLLSDAQVEIAGLVVDADHHGQGLGRALVSAAEGWARERAADKLVVRSNVLRAGAHPFYEGLGFVRVKTQHAYERPFGPS